MPGSLRPPSPSAPPAAGGSPMPALGGSPMPARGAGPY